MIKEFLSINPLIYMTQSLWRDEAFTYFMSKQPFFKIISSTALDFNPPFYYFIMKLWMILFGSSEVALRSFSLICFALSVYIVSLIFENIMHFSIKKTIFYSFLFLINPFLLYFAFEARMYSMLLLLTLASLYFLLMKRYKFWFFVSLVGLYTHYFFIFNIIGQFIAFYLSKFKVKEKKIFIKSVTILAFSFFPWVVFVSKNLFTNTGSFWFSKIRIEDFIQLPMMILTGFDNYQKYYGSNYIIAIFISWIIFIFVLINNEYKKKKYHLYFSILSYPIIFTMLLISVFKPIFTPRYIIGFSGVFLIFLFSGISLYKRPFKYIFILGLVYIFVSYGFLQNKYRLKGNIREQMKIIKSTATDKDIICVGEQYLNGYLLTSYYASGHDVYICADRDIQIPKFEGAILYENVKYLDKIPSFPQKAYIIKSDTEHDIKTIW